MDSGSRSPASDPVELPKAQSMSEVNVATLSGAVEIYIQSLMFRRRSANYILRARNYLDQLCGFLGADYPTQKVSHADLERFVGKKDIAFTTAGGIHDLLNACLTQAAKSGLEGELQWFAEREKADATPSQ